MGRRVEVAPVDEAPVRKNRAVEMKRGLTAWGVCQTNLDCALAYNDLVREVYAASGRSKLTQAESEALVEEFGLTGMYEKALTKAGV